MNSWTFIFALLAVSCLSKVLKPSPDGIENLERAIAENSQRTFSSEPLGKPSEVLHFGAVTTTVLGRTMTVDPGTMERIIDVVGVVSMSTGNLGPVVILDSVVQGEAAADGIAAFDPQNKQTFFSSDGAFGGTVFYANVANLTQLPPAGYYLNPVAFLGFDPVSGSRLISGTNTPGKNFLIMERPNWGKVSFFQMPAGLEATAADAYDGKSMNYYSVGCTGLGSCKLSTWNIKSNSVSSFQLRCLASNGFLSGLIFVDSQNPNILYALQDSTSDSYSLVTIDVSRASCVSAPLVGLPAKPVIIVSSQRGQLSGNFYFSIAMNGGSAIYVYNNDAKLVSSVRTGMLYEDIFVHEV